MSGRGRESADLNSMLTDQGQESRPGYVDGKAELVRGDQLQWYPVCYPAEITIDIGTAWVPLTWTGRS